VAFSLFELLGQRRRRRRIRKGRRRRIFTKRFHSDIGVKKMSRSYFI
jgi:hypothetical protein